MSNAVEVRWVGFIEDLEADVARLEAALAADGVLPELAPFDPAGLGELPGELRDRATRALTAVLELEQAIAVRLEQVARELSASDGRRHELRPSYGGLDVDC